MELQPLSLLFVQQEAIDVGEQLFRRQRGNEALSIHSELVQQHHAEVGPGDSEHLSAERHKSAVSLLKQHFTVSYSHIVTAAIINISIVLYEDGIRLYSLKFKYSSVQL